MRDTQVPEPVALGQEQPRTCPWAIAGFVAAFAGPFSCGVGGLAAIVLSIIALVKIKKSGGRLKGKGLAIAAIILAVLLSNPASIYLVDLLLVWAMKPLWALTS